jgi:hypothetical protein
MENTWSAIEAISTAFAALLVVAGLLYARSQIGEAQRNRNAGLLLEFQDRYHSLEMRLIRQRLITGELGPPSQFDPAQLNEHDRHAFWTLLDLLETLGVYVDKGLLDLDLVIAAFRSTPPQVWYCIRPYILENRQQRPPGYSFYLEKLIARYEEYYKERFGVTHHAYERIMKLEASRDKTSQSEDSIP